MATRLEVVMPKGAMRQADGTSPIYSLQVPATGDLQMDSDVKAPPWVRLNLPLKMLVLVK